MVFAAVDGVLDGFDSVASLLKSLGLTAFGDQLAAGLHLLRRNAFYQTPQAHWSQETPLLSGTVRGTVGALSDMAEGFTYSVFAQPTQGRVAIDSATGTWTYTADPDQTSVAGVGFTIKIADSNPTGSNLIDSSQETSTYTTLKLGDPGYQTTFVMNATTKPITYVGYQDGGAVNDNAGDYIPGDASAPYQIWRTPVGSTDISDFSVAMNVDPSQNAAGVNVLMPGERLKFLTIFYNLQNNNSVLNFSQSGGSDLQAIGHTSWTNGSSYCASGPQCGGGSGFKSGSAPVVVFQDASPDTVTVDPSASSITISGQTYTADEVVKILARLATSDNTTLKNGKYTYIPGIDPLNPPKFIIDNFPTLQLPVAWGAPVINAGSGDSEKVIGASVGVDQQFGWEAGGGLDVGLGEALKKYVDVKLSGELKHSWDWGASQEFSSEIKQGLNPYSINVLYAATQQVLQEGDLTVTSYNTTWNFIGMKNLFTDYTNPSLATYLATQPYQVNGKGFVVGVGDPADADFETAKTLRVGEEPLHLNAWAYVGAGRAKEERYTDFATWTSSNPSVATVSSADGGGKGVVTAHQAGTALITATYSWTMPNPTPQYSNTPLSGTVTSTFTVTVPQQTALTAVKSNGVMTLWKDSQDLAYVQSGTGPVYPVTRDDSYWTGEVPVDRPNNAQLLSVAAGTGDTPYLLLDRSDLGAYRWSLDSNGKFASSVQLLTAQALNDAAAQFGVPRSALPSAAAAIRV